MFGRVEIVIDAQRGELYLAGYDLARRRGVNLNRCAWLLWRRRRRVSRLEQHSSARK